MGLEQLCQIQVSGRHSFAHYNSLVTVESPIGRVRKRVSELKKGEFIAVKDDSHVVSKEEIEERLLRVDQGYRDDKAAVFEQNTNGDYVAKFRTLLWQGILGDDYERLASTVLLEGDDFDSTDYADAIDRVLETGVSVHRSTVKQWLNGDTYTPEVWDNFEKLAVLNPAFSEIFESKESAGNGEGFFFHYKRLVGTKQSIRKLVDNFSTSERDDSEDTPERRPSSLAIDYSEPRRHILEDMGDLLTKKIRFLEVRSVREVSAKSRQYKTAKKESPNLDKGIIFGQTDDVSALGYSELIDDLEILTLGLRALENIPNETKFTKSLSGGLLMDGIFLYVSKRLIKVPGLDDFTPLISLYQDLLSTPSFGEVCKDIYGWINGSLDGDQLSTIGCSGPELKQYLDVTREVKRQLPLDFLRVTSNLLIKRTEYEILKLKPSLLTTSASKRMDHLEVEMRRGHTIQSKALKKYGIQYSQKQPLRQLRDQFGDDYSRKGYKPFTTDDVATTLAKYGISDRIHFFDPRDFV